MTTLYSKIKNGEESIAVVGLGYVGIPIAVMFAAKGVNVIGFDLNRDKLELYKNGIDPTGEVGNDAIKRTSINFTSNEADLKNAKFHIVAVPTPINQDHTPDLTPVVSASEIVGRNLTEGSIVVFESTVYPGVTEDVCLPILERESGLKCGRDFELGYSPERINPGDNLHRLDNIVKIVSGFDSKALEEIGAVYNMIIKAGTYPVSSIKAAEAVKVAENSQRDINIAFMNELAIVFDRMGLDTNEIVDGMNTKWNALGFRPGLVGGHCIGVDPYYFTYKAENLGYHSQIILNGRMVNESIGSFVANAVIKQMVKVGKAPADSKVVMLGITFKENCPDTRNSKVADVYDKLTEYGVKPIVIDPLADKNEVKREYNIDLSSMENAYDADCIIVAVAHSEFKHLGFEKICEMFKESEQNKKVLIDIKGLFPLEKLDKSGITYWRL